MEARKSAKDEGPEEYFGENLVYVDSDSDEGLKDEFNYVQQTIHKGITDFIMDRYISSTSSKPEEPKILEKKPQPQTKHYTLDLEDQP